MFKKCLLIVFFVVLLAGCQSVPENLIPREYVEPNNSEQNFQIPASQEYESPSGSYILVRISSAGTPGIQNVAVDLYFNNNKVCTWNGFGSDTPWDREDQTLFFAPIEGNCPEMDSRNGVVWHVFSNYAEIMFNDEIIQEIPVWSLTGSQFFKHDKK